MAINSSLLIQQPQDGSWWNLTCDVNAEAGISFEYGIRSNDIMARTGTTGRLAFELDNDFRTSAYTAWWTAQKANYATRVGGGPYTPGLRFTSASASYDFFDYPVLDSDGASIGDAWFQVGNRVRLLEWEDRIASTRDGVHVGAAVHETVSSSDQIGTRSNVALPGSSSAIDLYTASMSSLFTPASGTLLISLAAIDNWGTQASARTIARLGADANNYISITHTSDGFVAFNCQFNSVAHAFTASEAALVGTSDNPVPAAFAVTWDSDLVEFYMSSAITSDLPFGGRLRRVSTVAATQIFTGTPNLFVLGAQTSDGATGALKAMFSGCALWGRVVDPSRMCPPNHHLTWYPDAVMSLGSTSDNTTSDTIGYWPFNEGSGTVAQEWGQTYVYFKFMGRVRDIKPDSGQFGGNRVHVTALDWLDDAATFKIHNIPTQVDATIDSAVRAVVEYSASQPAGIILDSGAEVFSFTTYDTSKGVTVLSELSKLAATEFGYVYMRGTRNSEGVPGTALVNEDRHARVINTTSNFSISDDGTSDVIRTIGSGQDLGSVKNVVEMTTHPADVDTDNVVVSALPASTVLELRPNATFIYTAKYLDSDQAFRVVGVSSIVSPVKTTDFIINSNAAGTGTDLGADYRQTMLGIDSANLLAYYTLSDPAGVAFRNEQSVTGAAAGSTTGQTQDNTSVPAVSGASGGSSGSSTSGTTTYQKPVPGGTSAYPI